MMVPAKPPQPTADAESFATSQMLGLGLSGAVLPGNVLRSVCEQCRVFGMSFCQDSVQAALLWAP